MCCPDSQLTLHVNIGGFGVEKNKSWVIICPEYPPDLGGVADYSQILAKILQDFGNIYVVSQGAHEEIEVQGITVVKEPGIFRLSMLCRLSRIIEKAICPRILFVQWVPHGYGYKSLNIFFPFWVLWRGFVRKDVVWLMVHEPFLAFSNGIRQRIAAVFHRGMIWLLLRSSQRVFTSNKRWSDYLEPWKPKSLEIEWLPVPSSLPPYEFIEASPGLLKEEEPCSVVVGHFGSFGHNTRSILDILLPKVVESIPGVKVLLIGRNSEHYLEQFKKNQPQISRQMQCSGTVGLNEIAAWICECDLMVQVCEGGVSTRNTSLMAPLALGKPVVATSGPFTEDEWDKWGACEFEDQKNLDGVLNKIIKLANSPKIRKEKGEKAKEIYQKNFSPEALKSKLGLSGGDPG